MTIFEQIIQKQIPARIIYEDDQVMAFEDANPKSLGHFLVIPKAKSQNLFDIKDKDLINLILIARKLAKKRVQELGLSGFELRINNGKSAQQEIAYTHIHIIPK